MFRDLFWNAEERRLRAAWRLAAQTALLAILYFGVLILASPLLGALLGDGQPTREGLARMLSGNPPVFALTSVATLVAVAGSVALGGRFIDRRRLATWFGLDGGWWSEFAFGLALGAGLMALIFLVELAAGWITVEGALQSPPGTSFAGAFLLMLVGFVCVGIYEELLTRGYHLKNLAEGLGALGPAVGAVAALVISAGVFGAAHATNPNATALSTLLVSLAGVFLGLGLVLTGRLAIPMGVHITWNLFQGNVFGFPVSGTGANATTFIVVEQGGPSLLTGGPFGPEAGLVGLGASILGSLLIVAWVRYRRGRVSIDDGLTTPRLSHEPAGEAS